MLSILQQTELYVAKIKLVYRLKSDY